MQKTSHFIRLTILICALLLVACRGEEAGVGDALNEAPAGATAVPTRPAVRGDNGAATSTAVLAPTPAFTPAPAGALAGLDVDALHEQIFAALMRRDPETATDLGVSGMYGIPNDQLTDGSLAFMQETQALESEYLDLLTALDTAGMTPAQKLSHEILIWELEDRVAGHEFSLHTYPVNQLFGVQNDLPSFMAGIHPLRHEQDARDYIARLQQFGRRFDDTIAGMEARAKMGVVPPKFVFDRVLAEMRNFINTPAAENIITTSFQRRVADIAELSGPEQEVLTAEVADVVRAEVYPAYERLIAAMEQLSAQATTDDGVWKLPAGEAYYTYTLHHHTTTDMTADEIHELGLLEVARIEAEMATLLEDLGYGSDPAAGIGQIYRNGGGISISNEAARAQAFSAYEQAMMEADEKLGPMFNIRPAAPLEIARVPEFRELTAPGAYYSPPPLDGSRPGIFYVNLQDNLYVSLVGVPTLAFHEGVPGHHFQLAIQRELSDVPTFRRANTYAAYAEGWALYVEKLAWEAGVYDDDPFGNYGRLQSELFRAVRLVVDTGIHDQGWTRQEAIDYMLEKLNWPEASIVPEVERYIVWPGQATAYKIGELTILRLRDKAEQALGDAFDIAKFHTAILENGNVPLNILEEIVDDYIADTLNNN